MNTKKLLQKELAQMKFKYEIISKVSIQYAHTQTHAHTICSLLLGLVA